ncbi:MAG TPA: hypothetical protein PKM50_02640 [Methanoregula sp.]|nr:hypothetical protein [Methanoregula sp.]
MTLQLSDEMIASLLAEQKVIPDDFLTHLKLKTKNGHKEFEKEITGENGSSFRLVFRQSDINTLDFSIILLYLPKGSNQPFRLRRHNGKSHEHTNPIEKNTFYGFHIHTATERYQQSGYREDTYAEETNRYADYHSAINCML